MGGGGGGNEYFYLNELALSFGQSKLFDHIKFGLEVITKCLIASEPTMKIEWIKNLTWLQCTIKIVI